MYDINTIEELLEAIYEMPEDPEYTIKEILEDGFTTGVINPELRKEIFITE